MGCGALPLLSLFAPAWLLAPLPASSAPRMHTAPPRRTPLFSCNAQERSHTPSAAGAPPARALDADAAALLDEAGGDVAKAKTSYIDYTLAYLETEMPELYEGLRTDPSRPDCHAALVELTYDAVAAFLPVTHDPTPTPAAQKKLGAIARAGVDGSIADASVLDVGCGTGLLLPFLRAAGAPPRRYCGIDVSSRMIDRAKADHAAQDFADARFEAVSLETFAEQAAADKGQTYDVIVFNAALQFFADIKGALQLAETMLSQGSSCRIVVAHLQGSAFVRQERQENPTVVLNVMPKVAELEAIARELGLRVLVPSFLGDTPDGINEAMEDFYLAVLIREKGDGTSSADEGN